jgi:uncharacterized protein YqgV (UPF0045/DUF77 family)
MILTGRSTINPAINKEDTLSTIPFPSPLSQSSLLSPAEMPSSELLNETSIALSPLENTTTSSQTVASSSQSSLLSPSDATTSISSNTPRPLYGVLNSKKYEINSASVAIDDVISKLLEYRWCYSTCPNMSRQESSKVNRAIAAIKATLTKEELEFIKLPKPTHVEENWQQWMELKRTFTISVATRIKKTIATEAKYSKAFVTLNSLDKYITKTVNK